MMIEVIIVRFLWRARFFKASLVKNNILLPPLCFRGQTGDE